MEFQRPSSTSSTVPHTTISDPSVSGRRYCATRHGRSYARGYFPKKKFFAKTERAARLITLFFFIGWDSRRIPAYTDVKALWSLLKAMCGGTSRTQLMRGTHAGYRPDCGDPPQITTCFAVQSIVSNHTGREGRNGLTLILHTYIHLATTSTPSLAHPCNQSTSTPIKIKTHNIQE